MTTYDAGGGLRPAGRRAALGLLIWLLLLGLGSAFVSIPFRLQAPGGASVDPGQAMYLQGLLAGMAGLTGLLAAAAFALPPAQRGTHAVLLWGALGAAALGGVGGILGPTAHGSLPAWLELAALVPLAAAMVALGASLLGRAARLRRPQEWTGALAALGAAGAAVMGCLADWIVAAGARPPGLLAGYAAVAGLSMQQWLAGLATGYTHVMTAAVVALAVAAACAASPGPGSRLMRSGLWLTAAGTVLTGVIYLVGGFSVAQPPILLQGGPGGVDGLWSGELSIGVGVLAGGTLALAGLGRQRLPGPGPRWSAALVTAMLLVLVTGFGSYVQLHESLYGMGALAAPRAAANAAFTWLRADFGGLLLPGVLVTLVAMRPLHVDGTRARQAGGALLAGSVVAFFGAVCYVFVQPAPTGPSFAIAAVGLALVVVGVLIAIRAALAGHREGLPA